MFMTNVAINGLGRIGRATLKIVMDTPELNLVAVNDLASSDELVYLLNYDTVYGRYDRTVETRGDQLVIDGHRVTVLSERSPARLPWQSLKVDIVFECTGAFTGRGDLEEHIRAGARYVILSAPSQGDDVETVVHGVNAPGHGTAIVSCASCTTNCITPVVEILGRRIGIRKAVLTAIHAYTASQAIVDTAHTKRRMGRAAAANIVPATTGAAMATTRALPDYRGRFHGIAVRVPVTVGSLADIVAMTSRPTTVEEVNAVFAEEAESERYRGVLGVTVDPVVSSDIIKDARASVVDLGMTQVVDGDLLKVVSWYDNEWGYSNQMVREAIRIASSVPRAGVTQ
jgi:glyceraldehyde 3-phosphate dehydrogenase